jgi:hypothetical protein
VGVPVIARPLLSAAVLVLATAATLTACGAAALPPTTAPSHPGDAVHPSRTTHPDDTTHPSRSAHATAIPGPPAGSQAEAAALARQLLSRVPLPPGAAPLPQTPLPRSLTWRTYPGTEVIPSLDQYRLFALRQQMGAAAAFLAARVPAGMGNGGTGSGGLDGSTMQDVTYLAQSVPAGIAGAQLVLTVVPASAGGSLLRVDAQVVWYPPRTAAEYIDPARYHVLSITVVIYGGRPHTVHKVVTSRAFIARLAELLDRLQAEPIGPVACPAIFADYQLAFSLSRHGRPIVVVSTNEIGCGGSGISVNGRQQPPLADDGGVAALADQEVSVTWEL